MPITRKKKRQIPMKKWVIGVFFTFKRQFVVKLEKTGQRQKHVKIISISALNVPCERKKKHQNAFFEQ